MSITPTTKARTRAKIALVPLMSLGLLGTSVAVAAPAEALTKYRGCDFDAKKPDDKRGNTVDFKIRIDCKDGTTVQIRQRLYEDDRGGRRFDDQIGDVRRFEKHFGRNDRAKTISSPAHIPNLDKRGVEEVYHIVAIRVKNDRGNWSDWSNWDTSETVTVHRGR